MWKWTCRLDRRLQAGQTLDLGYIPSLTKLGKKKKMEYTIRQILQNKPRLCMIYEKVNYLKLF